jgi:VanZ family protein
MQTRARRLRVLWYAIGHLLIGLVVVFSLMPNPPEGPDDPGNWSGHLLAYGTLMAWFAQLHERLAMRLAIALGFVALGVSMEFLQGLTDYRTYDVFDMLANTCGVALGLIASPPRVPNGLRGVERLLAR